MTNTKTQYVGNNITRHPSNTDITRDTISNCIKLCRKYGIPFTREDGVYYISDMVFSPKVWG